LRPVQSRQTIFSGEVIHEQVSVSRTRIADGRRRIGGAQSGPNPGSKWPAVPMRGNSAPGLGKPPQMNACLRENKTKLSDSCRKVVESRGG
jgi:hypothetical protein